MCFCGTFPRVAPAGRYPAPCFHGARTFLPRLAAKVAIRPSGEPIKTRKRDRVKRESGNFSRADRDPACCLGVQHAVAPLRPEMKLESEDRGSRNRIQRTTLSAEIADFAEERLDFVQSRRLCRGLAGEIRPKTDAGAS